MIAALALLLITDDRAPVTGFFDLPVTGGTATFDMLGLLPEERGQAVSLLAREMFAQSASAIARAAAVRNFVAQIARPGASKDLTAGTSPITIAMPLTADHWRDALQLDDKADLFAALITNRAALLTCAGVAATDPSMRSLLDRDRDLLRWIVRTTPAAFWVAGRSLKIERDRIAVPGGSAAEPIWEALALEKVTRPADFIRALLSRDGGRLAWFYDAAAAMPPDRYQAAFGAGPIEGQVEQARTFYTAFRSADSNWHLEEHPYLRGLTDPWMVSSQIDVQDGAVAPPAAQWFWNELFERGDLTRRAALALKRDDPTPVTLPWLTQRIANASTKERRDRYEMVRFAQGVFPSLDADQWLDAAVALGGYRKFKGVLLTLDRMDLRTPRVYARAVEAARRIDEELSGRDARNAVVAFQAALAIVERARLTHELAVDASERLVLSLSDAVDPEAPPGKRATSPFTNITRWITTTLIDALPPLRNHAAEGKAAYERRLLFALAGPPAEADAPRLTWEGLDYRIDLSGAEYERLTRIREQIESPGLDAALATGDQDRIANALLALIYTPALGDPEGPALLGEDIAMRHNFGLTGPAGLRREGLAWTPPREQVGDGSPWHVEGSIMGLDIALARLALRRIADNDMPAAPTINLNDQLTFARTVMALNARELTDADRDRIVAAIDRGRDRVKSGSSLAAISELAAEAQLPAAVRQTLPWTMARTPELAPALFTLRDLMWLGKPDLARATLNRWGVFGDSLDGRLRTVMPSPAPWDNFGGRSDGGLIASQAPDLILRLAIETARLKLPARLVPSLLMYAAQDNWHDVDSRFPDDWPAITRQALALSSSRVEDYVAALAGGGPLRQ